MKKLFQKNRGGGSDPTPPPGGGGLTRAPLGYIQPNAPRWGGGQILPPLPNSRTNRRSEAGEAAIESPEREDSSAHLQFSLRGHM